jgi:hypothetical protein
MMNDINGKPIFLSPSMLSRPCALQNKWFTVYRMKLMPGFFRAVGHAFHHVALRLDQPNFNKTGLWLPKEQLQDEATDSIKEESKEIPDTDDVVLEQGSHDKAYAKAQNMALATIDAYDTDRTVLAGRAHESRFELPFAGEKIKGYLDVDVDDAQFKDLKTRDLSRKGSRRKPQSYADEDRQFSGYAAVKAKLTGRPLQRLSVIMAYNTKDGVEIEPLHSARVAEQHAATEQYAHDLYRAMETDTLLPVDKSGPGGWCCSEKWCGAWDSVCPYGRRSVVSIAAPGQAA